MLPDGRVLAGCAIMRARRKLLYGNVFKFPVRLLCSLRRNFPGSFTPNFSIRYQPRHMSAGQNTLFRQTTH